MKLSARTGVVLIVLSLAALLATVSMHVGSKSPASSAASIVAECSGAQDHEQCYESLVPLLYPEKNISQLFEIVRSIRSADPSYQFCHVLAHKMGERVVAEDLNAWVNAISLNPPDGTCSNGFIHGVIGGRFRSEVLDSATIDEFLPDFRRACEPHGGWKPSDLDKAICYHGMGHVYDFITNADLSRALDLCEKTTSDQFRQVCVEGVFMQIYQPLEPDDFALIEQMDVRPTKRTVRKFCASFKNPEYVGACLRESWPMHEGVLDGTGVESFCSNQPNATEETSCYMTAAAIIGRLSLGDSEKAASACEQLPQKRQQMCFSTVAQAILEENRSDAETAIALCARAEGAVARSCMLSLVEQAVFIFGQSKSEMKGFCDALPVDISEALNGKDAVSPCRG